MEDLFQLHFFLCRSAHRKFLNVIVIPLYGSSGRPAKLHALSGQQYKAVVRFSLPGRQTNLRPGAVDVKDALRHAYKAFDTPCFSRKLYKSL